MNSIRQNVLYYIADKKDSNGLYYQDIPTQVARELLYTNDFELWIMKRIYKLVELREKIAFDLESYSSGVTKIIDDNYKTLYRKVIKNGYVNKEVVLVDGAQEKIDRIMLMQGNGMPKNISAMCSRDTSETDLLASLLCDHDERYNMHTRFENILQSFELAEKRNDVETMNKLQPEIDFRMVGYNRLGDIIHDMCKRTGKQIF